MSFLYLQNWFSDKLIHAISWTLIHSLWQGLVAALLAGIAIITTRKTGASLRYNLLLSIIGLFILSSLITFYLLASDRGSGSVNRITVASDSEDLFVQSYSPTTTANKIGVLSNIATYCDRNANLVVMIWVAFFFFNCIKLMNGFAGIRRIRQGALDSPGKWWLVCIDQLRARMRINHPVKLAESALVKVPVAIGFLKPIILVPVGLLSQLPPDQVETILLHELAHIRRHDYLVNILQRLVEAVFFFNPAILWISSVARREREACCDDMVIANTPKQGSYLEALVSFQEYSIAKSGYAMAIGNNRNILLNRVKRMITRENQKLNSMEKLCLTLGLMSIMAFTFIPVRETDNKKQEPAAAPVNKTEQEAITPVATLTTPVSTKRHGKTVSIQRAVTAPIDTVPSKKEATKQRYEDLSFRSMSSDVNDDGKTRTESVTVTDQNGKKYSYTKQDDKITSFSIDGKKFRRKNMTIMPSCSSGLIGRWLKDAR